MNNIRRVVLALLLVLMAAAASGCDWDYQALLQKTQREEAPLIRVRIQFTDDQQAECYVKSLGIDDEGVVYQGGPSLNYMYNNNGDIIGSYNYQRVLYLTILPEETTPD